MFIDILPWDLQPGDMLYLPPHFAHHGVALNDCMTFSFDVVRQQACWLAYGDSLFCQYCEIILCSL
jgi:hypothetical protein